MASADTGPAPANIRRRITTALFLSQSLFNTATIVGFTLTPIIVSELAGSERVAGLPSTLSLLSRAAFAYPLGWLMDRLGRRAGLSLSYFLGVVGSLVSLLAIIQGSLWGFLAGAFLFGMLRSGAEQARFVAAEVQPPDRRARAIGLVVFAGTIGSIGGPLLVAPASSWAESLTLPAFGGPFLASGVMLLVALAILVLFLRPDPLQFSQADAASEGPSVEEMLQPVRSLRQLWREPAVRLAITAMAIGQGVMTLLMVITPVHMSHADHSQQTISWVIMAHTLGMFGLSGLTGRLTERLGRRRVILGGSLILALSAVLAPLSPAWVPLALALFLLGLGWNLCFIAGSSLLAASLTASERGRGQGSGEMMVAVGASAGSLGSGWLFAEGGILLVAAIGFGFSLALIVFTVARLRRAPTVAGA